jgi:heat-inducible transcriptional repressor
MSLPIRSEYLLKTLIERFIADGQPLASKALVEHTGLDISSATIRNIMAELEDLGLVTSRHTSGGKVPTAKGYRLFVDSLLVNLDNQENQEHYSNSTSKQDLSIITNDVMQQVKQQNLSPKQALTYASKSIAELTSYACVVHTPYQDEILQQVELIKLSSHKILVIFVSTHGEIQNHIFSTKVEYSNEQLSETMQFINNYCHGLTISTIHTRLTKDINSIQTHILELTQATILINQKLSQINNLLITGEGQLIASDLAKNMQELKQLFNMFDKKQEILEFLQELSHAHGVHIFIGGENEINSLMHSNIPNIMPNISMVTAPCNNKNNFIGTLGVIGPTRMHYNKVISILNITTKCIQDYYSDFISGN